MAILHFGILLLLLLLVGGLYVCKPLNSPVRFGFIFVGLQVLIFVGLLINAEIISPGSEEAVWLLVIPLLPTLMIFPQMDYLLNESIFMLLLAFALSSLIIFAAGWLFGYVILAIRKKFISARTI